MQTGVRAARGEWIVTLDGDGQNDPADIPVLLQALEQGGSSADLKLIVGNRKSRRDPWLRRVSSRIANAVRRRMLRDNTPDTGCGIKLFHRETFLQLPAFNHMHRFLPALFQRAGARVMSVEVRHRSRTHGRSKYGLGNRLWVGIVDLFGAQRYPATFERFVPACRSNELQHCSPQELVNAYDNTIAYADHVLSLQIDMLRAAATISTAC